LSCQYVDKKLAFVDPKTSRSRRSIPMPGVCVRALTAHRTRQAEERLAAGSKWQDHNLVFATVIGTPLDPRNVSRRFGDLCKAAGIRHIRLHDLRHTCATLLLAQGVAPRVVMETLGHSGISLTMNTYIHVLPVLQRDAASKIDALLGA
jgi:integrase